MINRKPSSYKEIQEVLAAINESNRLIVAGKPVPKKLTDLILRWKRK
tara:strand:+ start:161 stop:301 length:141 start_codon:yes stop_codon:yes gene_type:complete